MTVRQAAEADRLGRAAFTLDRREVVSAVIGRHEDFLIVSGLAGPAQDVAALTDDGAHVFILAGAMGAAVPMGLGLALAQPDRPVLVVTGDGELLMNLGSLATVAVLGPANLSILVVDNGHHGETGFQRTHTSFGTDLEAVARGCGIPTTMTVADRADLAAGAGLLRRSGPVLVVLRVAPTESARYARNFNAGECRVRFRAARG
jgi:thiamine pyrophosphate-dependent acetolactate synthase large subunit-like protein